jgi:hypothetical protein
VYCPLADDSIVSHQMRTYNPSQNNGGVELADMNITEINHVVCPTPVPGSYSAWTNTHCDDPYSELIESRTRTYNPSQNNGGEELDTLPLFENIEECPTPVDGSYSSWENHYCSLADDSNIIDYKTRTYTGPSNRGLPNLEPEGTLQNVTDCPTPVPGSFTESVPVYCPLADDLTVSHYTRTYIPSQNNGGLELADMNITEINHVDCPTPIDGSYSSWENTQCADPYSTVVDYKTRTYAGPSNGGEANLEPEGTLQDVTDCPVDCVLDDNNYDYNTECILDESDNLFYKEKTKQILTESKFGGSCINNPEFEQCLPVNGTWGVFSNTTQTCGEEIVTRDCNNTLYGGVCTNDSEGGSFKIVDHGDCILNEEPFISSGHYDVTQQPYYIRKLGQTTYLGSKSATSSMPFTGEVDVQLGTKAQRDTDPDKYQWIFMRYRPTDTNVELILKDRFQYPSSTSHSWTNSSLGLSNATDNITPIITVKNRGNSMNNNHMRWEINRNNTQFSFKNLGDNISSHRYLSNVQSSTNFSRLAAQTTNVNDGTRWELVPAGPPIMFKSAGSILDPGPITHIDLFGKYEQIIGNPEANSSSTMTLSNLVMIDTSGNIVYQSGPRIESLLGANGATVMSVISFNPPIINIKDITIYSGSLANSKVVGKVYNGTTQLGLLTSEGTVDKISLL